MLVLLPCLVYLCHHCLGVLELENLAMHDSLTWALVLHTEEGSAGAWQTLTHGGSIR